MFTLGFGRKVHWWLLGGLFLSLLLSTVLPSPWGWENGHLENFQALTLLAGLVIAGWSSWSQHHHPTGAIWRIAAIFWLCMVGRELAWGAVFYAPLSLDAQGAPIYSSSVLWFKPVIKWACCALLLLCIFWVLRGQLLRRVIWPWLQQRAMPWHYLALFVMAMVLSAHAEGNVSLPYVGTLLATGAVAEEMAECWAYLALFFAQGQLITHSSTQLRHQQTPPSLVDLDIGTGESPRSSTAQSLQ